jgi:hypothetical protein
MVEENNLGSKYFKFFAKDISNIGQQVQSLTCCAGSEQSKLFDMLSTRVQRPSISKSEGRNLDPR